MALGPTCIPTIREEIVRLQQADLHDLRRAVAHETAGRRLQPAIARRSAVVTREWFHRPRTPRLLHVH